MHTDHTFGGFFYFACKRYDSLFILHRKEKKPSGFSTIYGLGLVINSAQIDHGCFHSVSTIIRKVQTLACAKKQRCIQSLGKHLIRSSSGELVGLPDPHVG